MKREWVKTSLELSRVPAEFYSGARKILRSQTFTFKEFTPELVMADAGFTKSKMSMLVRNYLNEESRQAALQLWDRRLEQAKYGSIGFSTYNHYIKGGGLRTPWELSQAKKSGKPHRASVMGPCIQSVTLTLLNNKRTAVDVFYRTTELFKKFPADLVFLRDILLTPFNFKDHPIESLTFYFANVTCHPMYFITMVPHIKDIVAELDELKKADKYFFDWCVKWSARYVCPEHFRGIEKFAQAMRVRQTALEAIRPRKMKELQEYLRDNHPGYRKEYVDPDGGDGE